MVETKIGGRPVYIEKEKDGTIRIIFHPMAKGVKHPKAKIFSIKLSKSDLEMLQKAKQKEQKKVEKPIEILVN